MGTTTDDAALRFGYRPLFGALARACERLWPLQHGRIQLYLVYIVGALMLVFAVEVWLKPFPPGQTHVERLTPPSAEVELSMSGMSRADGELREP